MRMCHFRAQNGPFVLNKFFLVQTMLMNHQNYHFTQIPDKTNDMIFLKKSKNHVFGPFLTIFWSFLPNGDSVTHNYIWAPNTC